MILNQLPESGEGLKVYLGDRPWTSDVAVYLYERIGGETRMWHFDEAGQITRTVYQVGQATPDIPTFTLSRDAMEMLYAAMTRAGVQSPAKLFVEGKLEATEHHLEDLRTLLDLQGETTLVGARQQPRSER